MAFYTATVSATSNGSANTDDTFVELVTAASSAIRVHRVEVGIGTAASDTVTTITLIRGTGAGATGSAYTVLQRDTTMRATATTCNVKNGTNAFSVGTGQSTLEIDKINGRGTWRWIPSRPGSEIYVAGSAYFKVLIQSTGTSIVHSVTVEWEE